MNKAQAIENLDCIRWALDTMPDDATIVAINGGGMASKPEVQVDPGTVRSCDGIIRTRRLTLTSVERYRMVGNVKVFCVELNRPVPEGV